MATQENSKELSKNPVEALKSIMAMPTVQEQFRNALGENSNLFVASLIDVFGSDNYLQLCPPREVVMEALKAATLKLPINKGLGFAYIVPYAKSRKEGNQWVKEQHPQFQIGYRGLIQLAMRTGQYKYINADFVFSGELVRADKLTGEIDLSGVAKSDAIIGYFAHMETVNGFRKTEFWTVGKMQDHAEKYSEAYKNDIKKKQESSPWSKHFDAMAKKTVLRSLLGKYGILSVEMVAVMVTEEQQNEPEKILSIDAEENANIEEMDIDISTGEVIDGSLGGDDIQMEF